MIKGETINKRTQNNHAATTRTTTKQRIVAAYESYQRKEPGSADYLMALVRDFAYTKVVHLDYEFNSADSADDWAQDVALIVWERLATYEGDPESFYAWVHKIAFNRGQAAFNQLKNEASTRVDLQHEVAEGDESFEDDNSEIYEGAAPIQVNRWTETETDPVTGKTHVAWTRDSSPRDKKKPENLVEPVSGSETSQFDIGVVSVHTPKWVRGENLTICNLMLRGMTYKEIGVALGITEQAIKDRMRKIRQRVKAERSTTG
jgi:RNA polymerase sigma factor (sigma-70 family)